jgi:predicted  nucleic acid-binding Zn-ribbon protein
MHKINGNNVETTLLAEELAPLNEQIEKTKKILEVLENELHVIETEVDKFSSARERFNTLGEVCTSLEKLAELDAGELFWEGLSHVNKAEDHLSLIRGRISEFENEISGILEKQESLKSKINDQLDELDDLNELVRVAYERDERRKEEFVVEREETVLPFREMIMPWTKEAESERRFRKAVLVALLVSFVFGTLFHIVKVPVLEREIEVVEIPERLARLVKKEPIIPIPQPKQLAQKKEEPTEKPKDETKPVPKKQEMAKKSEDNEPKVKSDKTRSKQVAGGGGGVKAARKKAERVGVLAFKNAFSDLMDETPVAKLGTEARLRKDSPLVAGQAVAQRSIISIQAKNGSSGGISYANVSRNVGSGNGNGLGGSGIGRGGSTGNGSGFADVESSIADIEESSRPLSDGVAAGRTDEEIQIVFDRYKATLYRIYNRELRKDPTLRGKILLRLSIEPNGSISLCEVESTDLASPELVTKIVERIERFNFGSKDGVPTITILYPIDFLPAG